MSSCPLSSPQPDSDMWPCNSCSIAISSTALLWVDSSPSPRGIAGRSVNYAQNRGAKLFQKTEICPHSDWLGNGQKIAVTMKRHTFISYTHLPPPPLGILPRAAGRVPCTLRVTRVKVVIFCSDSSDAFSSVSRMPRSAPPPNGKSNFGQPGSEQHRSFGTHAKHPRRRRAVGESSSIGDASSVKRRIHRELFEMPGRAGTLHLNSC